MTKHIHVHLTHDAGINTRKSSGGVTTWGGANPKKVVPKAPGLKPIQDAGTSEGAKKAAQTRKAHGGGRGTAKTAPGPLGRGRMEALPQPQPKELAGRGTARIAPGPLGRGRMEHFPGTEGTHFAGKPLATQPKKNTANEHAQAAAYHNQKAGFPRTNKEHGEAAALHQHARMMHESPNSMIRSKANAASEKAWAASKKAK